MLPSIRVMMPTLSWGDDREVVKKMAESFDDDDDFKNANK